MSEDPRVEAAAMKVAKHVNPDRDWLDTTETVREHYRHLVRLALEPAQGLPLPAPKYAQAAVEFPEWRNLAQFHADALGPAGALARAVLTLTDPDIYFVRPVFIEVGEWRTP